MFDKDVEFALLVRFACMLGMSVIKIKGTYHVVYHSKFIKFDELVSIYNKGANSKFYSKHVRAHISSFVGMCISLPRKPLKIKRKDLKNYDHIH